MEDGRSSELDGVIAGGGGVAIRDDHQQPRLQAGYLDRFFNNNEVKLQVLIIFKCFIILIGLL